MLWRKQAGKRQRFAATNLAYFCCCQTVCCPDGAKPALQAPSLTLRGIEVVNGTASNGGGVLVHGAGSTLLMEQSTVRDSVATGEYPDGGGGVEVRDYASAVLKESTVADCSADGCGGGLSVYSYANLTLRGSRVERGVAPYGGCVNGYTGCRLELLEGTVISEGHATEMTGGLEAFNGCAMCFLKE